MALKTIYQGPYGAVAIDEQQNTTVSADYDAVFSDYIITATGTGNFTITLPPANPSNGKNVVVKCLTTNPITVSAQSGEFIDTVPSKTLLSGEVLEVLSDGTKWINVAGDVIPGSKIIDGTITGDKIASGAITEIKLATNSVTADKIASGAVGTSEINTSAEPTVGTIYSNNWFRSNGNTGWYNQTHGGGIYMEDSTWVRTYGGKNFYCSGAIRADGGFALRPDPGGGSGDSATITYTALSGELTELKIEVTNDAQDRIRLQSPTASLYVSDYGSFNVDNGYIQINGNRNAPNGISCRIPSCNGSANGSMPSGWSGISTWDITCASISYLYGVQQSDERRKNKITKLTNNLEKLLKIQPVSFIWKDGLDSSGEKVHHGFIAQNVEKVIPELVMETSDGYKTLAQTELLATVFGAIQEQQAQIETLEERIKKLEELIKS